MESLLASLLLYKNPSDKSFLIYSRVYTSGGDCDRAGGLLPHQKKPLQDRCLSVYVNMFYQELLARGRVGEVLNFNMMESGRRNSPWTFQKVTTFTCKYVLFLKGFFFLSENCQEFPLFFGVFFLQLLSLWSFISSSLIFFTLTFQSDKPQMPLLIPQMLTFMELSVLPSTLLKRTGGNTVNYLISLSPQRKYHTLTVLEKTSALASVSPVAFPCILRKVSARSGPSASIFKQMPHEVPLNGCRVISHLTSICQICWLLITKPL